MSYMLPWRQQLVHMVLAAVLAFIPTSVTKSISAAEPITAPIQGMVGVGTWATQAEFKDIKVTRAGKTLFSSDFTRNLDGWKTTRGQWTTVDGHLRQTSTEEAALALIGEPTWSNYTLTLKARKISGIEGFLIVIGSPDGNSKSWWNLGGWGNTKHGLELPGTAAPQVAGSIATNRWYDIKVELHGNSVSAYLDNQLIHTATRFPAQRDFGRALIPDLTADPSIAELDGTFYYYGTTDGAGQGLATSGLPVVWKSKDFLNWSFSGSIFPANFDAKYWAPSAPVLKDGRYYLFPTLDNRITALVANSPEGPFRTLDGKDITKTSGWKHFPISVGHPIDAEIFRDDDGVYYMLWSQRYIAKMNADFSGFDGPPTPITTKRGGYSEGPAIIKRNGIYYYLYTLGGSENYQYAYMMSRTSPLGPWQAPQQDIIASTNREVGIYGPGHGCFFNPKGSAQWVFVYLEYGRSGTNRHVMADKMNFRPDGTIEPIQLTLQGVGALRPSPIPKTPNLAQGKKALASSTRPEWRVPPIADSQINRVEGFDASNALDGSNGSRWLPSETDTSTWYQLDLGKVQNIKRTELYFVQPTVGHAYQLEYSLDGKSWRPYATHREPKIQSPHSDLSKVRARYLKLTISQGTPGLWEFRVY